MRKIAVSTIIAIAVSSLLFAQQTPPSTMVPRLVRINSSFRPANGQPAAQVEGVTLSIYQEEHDGAPLWQEVQNVSVDSEGRYSLLLGSTLNDGLPLELFTSGGPRWLGIRFNRPGEVEQPRTLLTSVPYALRAEKAVDAETLGGKPASAYLLSEPAAADAGGSAAVAASATLQSLKFQPRVTSGTPGCIALFLNVTDLGCSVLSESLRIPIVNATTPRFSVQLNDGSGTFTGYSVQNLSGGEAAISGMQFFDEHGALAQFQGFSNSTHQYQINNLASGGTLNFMIGYSTKLQVENNGDIYLSGSVGAGGGTVLQLGQLDKNNIGLGTAALASNTMGSNNTASGFVALETNTSGSNNTASGAFALQNNQSDANTASGTFALLNNKTGASNTAIGVNALGRNESGNENTASGVEALRFNTNGSNNTAIGAFALGQNTTGSNNIAVGLNAAAGVFGDNSNNIHIGNIGFSGDNGTIRIGGGQTSFFAAGIRGVTTGINNAVPVVIDSNGQLGTISSSRRFKEDIQDMGEASRGLMRLRPVTFRYQKPFADGSKPIQYGLIAEEVNEVYPDLVAHSADGQIETVKYQVLDSMLLNEVQRQQAEIDAQRDQVRVLQHQIDELKAMLASISKTGSK